MRKLSLVLLLACGSLAAQVNPTPNLGLSRPPFQYPHYDIPLNANADILDNIFAIPSCDDGIHGVGWNPTLKKLDCEILTGGIAIFTVGTLPAAPPTGTVAVVSDGNSGTDCATGGGANLVFCRFGISSWGTFSGGAASAGGSPTQLQYNNLGTLAGFSDGTAHQILHGGRAFGAVDLATADVTGLLPEANIANLASDLSGKASTSHTHAATDIVSGTLAAARLGLTTNGDLAVVSGGTLLRLAKGADGTVLGMTGGIQAWVAAAGGGNVSNSGTPVANQIGVWTNATTQRGVTGVTVDPATGNMVIPGSFTAGPITGTTGAFTGLTATGLTSLTPSATSANGALKVAPTATGTPAAIFNCANGITVDCFDVSINGTRQFFVDLNGAVNFQASNVTSPSFFMANGSAFTPTAQGAWWATYPQVSYNDGTGVQNVATDNISTTFLQPQGIDISALAAGSVPWFIKSEASPTTDRFQCLDSTGLVQCSIAKDFGFLSPYFKTTGTGAGQMGFAAGTNQGIITNQVSYSGPASLTGTGYDVALPGVEPTAAQIPMIGTCTSHKCTSSYIQLFATNSQTATYQVLAADFAACKTIPVASGTFTITLVASGSQPADGQCIHVVNYGSGVVTIARSGQNINGAAANLTLAAGSASAPTTTRIVSNGTDYVATASSSAGSVTLDNVGALGATATNTFGAGFNYSFAGNVTAAATPAVTITNLNSTNSNASSALFVTTTGTSTAAIPLIVNNSNSSTGDIADFQQNSVKEFGVTNSGSVQLNGATIGGLTASTALTLRTGLDGSFAGTDGLLTARGSDNANNGATNAAGGLTLRGGNETGATAATIAGAVTIQGGDATSTSTTAQAGNLSLRSGRAFGIASATDKNGKLSIIQTFFTTGTATVGSLACVTASLTVATCTSAANNAKFIGIITAVTTNTVDVQTSGTVNALALSATFTAGDYACADTTTTAGDVVDSSSACANGAAVGIVLQTATTTTPEIVLRAF